MFNPQRLILARKRRKMTARALAGGRRVAGRRRSGPNCVVAVRRPESGRNNGVIVIGSDRLGARDLARRACAKLSSNTWDPADH